MLCILIFTGRYAGRSSEPAVVSGHGGVEDVLGPRSCRGERSAGRDLRDKTAGTLRSLPLRGRLHQSPSLLTARGPFIYFLK